MKKKSLSFIIAILILFSLMPIRVLSAEKIYFTAAPTASVVLVNDKEVSFDSYNINGNNYFKLRDLAYILNGTGCQFEVIWDGGLNAINLISGEPYTEVGGEMTTKGTARKSAAETTSKIYLDGEEINLNAYNISGNNYFKLREIGKTFDFRVDWDGDKNTIIIDSNKSYYPETDEFESILFKTIPDANGQSIIKGVTIIFNGRFEEIIPEYFTEILLSRNNKIIVNKLIYDDFEQNTKDDRVKTYFTFTFEKEIDLFGIYQFSGSYRGELFMTEEFNISEPPKPDAEDFYFAMLEFLYKDSVKYALIDVFIRFNGTHDYINPDDFTDMKLTKDGTVVNVKPVYKNRFSQFEWLGDGTNFYFEFENEITEPGVYSFSGKYMGVPFKIASDIIIESSITDEPANPDDINNTISYVYYTNKNEQAISINEFVFSFSGMQNSFYQSDLTDLKITLNGEEIDFEFEDYAVRYLDVVPNSFETSYNLILKERFTAPGVYEITCKYMGKELKSGEITVFP
ncbi:MAG: copper amine oxidase N-terminal domain-containing protein [Oscillospiraceae bacterium]|nr:copper amine oxidase N-terminal domain-containing protein [Oscillospiraceae bacterium]